MPASPCPYLWLNNDLFPADSPTITAQDRGLLLGDGLFETMQLRNGQIPFLAAHLTRLEEGCRILHLPPPKRDIIQTALGRLIAANGLTDGSARLTLTRGPGPRGLAPPATPHTTLLITTAPPPNHAPHPVRLHISTQRRDRQAVLNRVKSISALPAILARMEAQELGADDALWLTHEGEIAEATAASFLALMDDGQIITPPLSAGILPGISRARLLSATLCTDRPLLEADIPQFRGAWLVTALSLTPVTAIGAHKLPLQPEQTARLSHFLYDTP
ncbi:aminotransferase class IV [Bombella favorum]|uniref:Probable branched-chain-amino-acid aminotransferase n=1 Tax=Bombella favorum TaxID=2039164 RepID=A0ABR5ZN20_9PROT|nr:aminotransferase class IV [Bombella favorum]MBA5725633.1 aminotransferase class IV [Bombella favorum]